MSNLNLGLGTSSSSSSICRYKGVVALPNGHWGAQIYANLQRVWLGTFKTERDAAMAYDSAAVKLGCSESHRNVPITPDHLAIEMDFQSHFSDEAVLIMIKDGSYPSKLAEFCRSWQSHPDPAGLLSHHYPGSVMRLGGGNDILYKDYFEKELTPSDVGKLNRLNLGLGTSSSSSSSICRYKGVVALPNGHWGAQIYANLQRVWLGTFKTERDAAMAYDSAAVKLGCSESHRNVPITPDHLAIEMDFQSHFSDEAVLIMIKDGSYPSKLGDFCRSWRDQAGLLNHHYPGGVMRIGGGEEILYKDCFEKVLTPSDIGKLNRLVIPKKYAIKFFPQVSHVERPDASVNGGETADADLDFFDRTMKRWTFRYCSWKSSQSFVFTKGWNKFVKEKGLKTKDVVIFYSCEMKPTPGNLDKVTPFTMIDFRQCGPDGAGAEDADEAEEGGEMMNQGQGENVEMVRANARVPVLRLFGVDIIKDQTN